MNKDASKKLMWMSSLALVCFLVSIAAFVIFFQTGTIWLSWLGWSALGAMAIADYSRVRAWVSSSSEFAANPTPRSVPA